MLSMNILGDGKDVWPYTDYSERYRFDCSKLDQWELVFDHMESLGMMTHFVLQETENEVLLDAGYTDIQRRIYLRELVARFGHHLAVTWNLGRRMALLTGHLSDRLISKRRTWPLISGTLIPGTAM